VVVVVIVLIVVIESVARARQPHTPAWHEPGHTVAHAPQLYLSLVRSRQVPAQL
jgi:hypothetical protein